MTTKLKEEITVHIYDTRMQMGAAAAKAVSGAIGEVLMGKDEVNMVFAAAPSQNEFLAALVQEDIDWGHINAFHMDEYIGLSVGSTASFAHYLQTHLFNKVHCKMVHYIDGHNADTAAACSQYTQLLQQYPIDIVCMGIGENTHIAFNDPPVADFDDKNVIKVVALDEACRQQQVNDGCFPSLADVPTHALTLTVPALLNCSYIFCIVPGERKAQAIFHTFSSPVSKQYPSTALRTHDNVQMFLDSSSSTLLNV